MAYRKPINVSKLSADPTLQQIMRDYDFTYRKVEEAQKDLDVVIERAYRHACLTNPELAKHDKKVSLEKVAIAMRALWKELRRGA